MPENKSHYYDGIIYDKFIAPNQDLLFRLISGMIKENSTVLDVGCGTGRLAFQLAGKCKEVVGIDLSLRNIKRAEKNRQKNKVENVRFLHTSLEELTGTLNEKFDYVVMTYVIHEVPPEERMRLFEELKKAGKKIILGDYLIPRPKGYPYYMTEFIEFIAGRSHYHGFKTYEKNGGLRPLFEQAGLKIIKEIKGKPETAHIILAEVNSTKE